MSDADDDEEPPFMPSAPSDFNIFKDSLKETLNNIYAETRLNLPSVKMDDTDVRGPASAVLVGARLRLLLQDDDSEEEEIFFSGHEPLDPAGANDFVFSTPGSLGGTRADCPWPNYPKTALCLGFCTRPSATGES